MPSVPLTYVIGTVGMLAVLGIVTLISTTQGISFQTQSTEASLTDAAQYVASELSTITATAMSGNNQTLAYRLVFPQQLNTKGYAFTITDGSQGWMVLAYLPGQPSVSGSSMITFQTPPGVTAFSVCIYNTASNPNNCIHPGLGITVQSVIYSGDNNAVVWATVQGGSISIGLGDLPQ